MSEMDKNSPHFIKAMDEVKKASKRLKLKKDEVRGVILAVEEMFKKAVV